MEGITYKIKQHTSDGGLILRIDPTNTTLCKIQTRVLNDETKDYTITDTSSIIELNISAEELYGVSSVTTNQRRASFEISFCYDNNENVADYYCEVPVDGFLRVLPVNAKKIYNDNGFVNI